MTWRHARDLPATATGRWQTKLSRRRRITLFFGGFAVAATCAIVVWSTWRSRSPRSFSIVGSLRVTADSRASEAVSDQRIILLDARVGRDAVLPCINKTVERIRERLYYQQMTAARVNDYASATERREYAQKIAATRLIITQLQHEFNAQRDDYDVHDIVVKLIGNSPEAASVDRIFSAATISTSRTNADGSFTFSGVAPGTYYVHAAIDVGPKHLEWYVPTSVAVGDAIVKLETRNAAISVPTEKDSQ